MVLNAESSWVDICVYMHERDMDDLAFDRNFCLVIADKRGDPSDSSYVSFVNLITDMLHDHFGFSSEQRTVARQHIVAKTLPLYDIFKMFDDLRKQNAQPTFPLPIGGATSPYPAQRGRAPKREDTEVLSVASMLPAPAAPRPRASSEPPQLRFGDLCGVLARQPLAQLMRPQAAPSPAGSPAEAPSPQQRLPNPRVHV